MQPPVTTIVTERTSPRAGAAADETSCRSIAGKYVLSEAAYQGALARIIQRDYYPSSLPAAVDEPSVFFTAASTASLTSFHAVTTSHEAAALHERYRVESRAQSLSHERVYLPPLAAAAPAARPAELRNALFFPPVDAPAATDTSSSISHSTEVDFRPRPQKAMDETPLLLSGSGNGLVSKEETDRMIVPAATRFMNASIARKKPDDHWEGLIGGDDGDSDASTDLDESVNASIRSEIRQAKGKRRRRHETALVVPDMALPLSAPYQLPAESHRDQTAAVVLQRRRGQVARLRQEAVVAVPATMASAAFRRSTAPAAPSARSGGALAFALRSAYSAKATAGVEKSMRRKRVPKKSTI